MGRARIEDLKVPRVGPSGGRPRLLDAIDRRIQCFYSYNPPEYAVYRTALGVQIQFADESKREKQQRIALAPLAPLRGQITSLIDGWREGYSDEFDADDAPPKRGKFLSWLLAPIDRQHEARSRWRRAQAQRYDKRVADALVLALARQPTAGAVLSEIKDDIIAQRKSLAKTDYFKMAGLFAVVMILLLGAITANWFDRIHRFPEGLLPLWTGAGGGTIGALFSIAIGIGSRTILVDLQKRDNQRDAIVRITIGTIGGAVAIGLVMLGLVSALNVDGQTLEAGAPMSSVAAFVIGFFAGFSERAVPDLLARASLVSDGATARPSGGGQDEAKAATTPTAPVAGPDSGDSDADEPADDDPEEVEDDCLSDEPPREDEITNDSELPPASGGVEPSPAPQRDFSPAGGDAESASPSEDQPPPDEDTEPPPAPGR